MTDCTFYHPPRFYDGVDQEGYCVVPYCYKDLEPDITCPIKAEYLEKTKDHIFHPPPTIWCKKYPREEKKDINTQQSIL
jgi:hypothetical protein